MFLVVIATQADPHISASLCRWPPIRSAGPASPPAGPASTQDASVHHVPEPQLAGQSEEPQPTANSRPGGRLAKYGGMRPAAGQLGPGQQCGPGEQVSDPRPPGGGVCFHFPPSVSTWCFFFFSFLLRSLTEIKSSRFHPLSHLDVVIEQKLARNINKKKKSKTTQQGWQWLTRSRLKQARCVSVDKHESSASQ